MLQMRYQILIISSFLSVILSGCSTYKIVSQNVLDKAVTVDLIAVDALENRGNSGGLPGNESMLDIMQFSLRRNGFAVLDKEQYRLEKTGSGLTEGTRIDSRAMIELSRFTAATHILRGWVQRETAQSGISDLGRVVLHLSLFELRTGLLIEEVIVYSPLDEMGGAKELQKVTDIAAKELQIMTTNGGAGRETNYLEILWKFGIRL